MKDDVDSLVDWIERAEDTEVARVQRMVHFVLPLDAIVAVAAGGDERLLDLRLQKASEFPRPGTGSDAAALVADLEAIRSEGVHFLVIPSTSREWFDKHHQFEAHVRQNFRTVIDEDGTAAFALQDHLLASTGGIGSDGLPLPPIEMVRLTAGIFRNDFVYELFVGGGIEAANWIKESLQQNDLDIEEFQAILDFGCGCGRIIRHLRTPGDRQLYGTDYNPYLIRWCQENLPFASFSTNGMAPELDYPDNTFDLIYSASVFTHLLAPLQIPWAAELIRVLQPGGYLLFTTHGVGRLNDLAPEQQVKFESGELIVRRVDLAGTNACEAFHPEAYLRDEMAPALGVELVGFHPDAAKSYGQDVVLARKPVA
jgi:SAM-dependent methyltransferase